MNKKIRKYLRYAFEIWGRLFGISVVVIIDYGMIYIYNASQPRVSWWAMLFVLVIPLHILCGMLVFFRKKEWETLGEVFTKD